MPLVRFPTPAGLVYTIDLSKIADRENPRTVEAPIGSDSYPETVIIDWGDGSAPEVKSSGKYPEHTYAAAGIYTVTIRCATGHLPAIRPTYWTGSAEATNPTKNITLAIVSLDHFGGISNTGSSEMIFCYACKNMTYLDTRFMCQAHASNMTYALNGCEELEQPFESFGFEFVTATTATFLFTNCKKLYGGMKPGSFDNFAANMQLSSFFAGCEKLEYITPGLFDFATQTPYLNSIFRDCKSLTSIPEGLFDNCISAENVSLCFQACTNIIGEPYKFWEQDYAANITNSANCYFGCSAALRAQVPTAYGGTMTVS